MSVSKASIFVYPKNFNSRMDVGMAPSVTRPVRHLYLYCRNSTMFNPLSLSACLIRKQPGLVTLILSKNLEFISNIRGTAVGIPGWIYAIHKVIDYAMKSKRPSPFNNVHMYVLPNDFRSTKFLCW